MIKRLRRKFIAVTVVSVTLVLLLVLAVVNVANYRITNNELDLRMSLILNDERMHEDEASKPPETPETTGADKPEGGFRDFRKDIVLSRDEEEEYFTVTITDGEVSASDCLHTNDIKSDTAEAMAKERYENGEDYGFVENWKYGVYYENGDENSLTYIFLNCSNEKDTLKSTLILSILMAIAAEALVIVLVASLSRLVTKPVAESYEKQKRFITDASHELKTPIAIIDANTEVMEMTSGETEWTKSNKRACERLSGLIEKMVFLSRMDEENAQYLTMIDFDLSEAVNEVAESFYGIAESGGRGLKLNVEDGIRYHGDEATIRQMISLLLDNAFKYASEGSEISLMVTKRESGRQKILIEQTNSVDEIQKGDLDILFDRFYRADESRSSEKGGHGIGLSVVRAIVQAHKGSIHAESKDGHSIRFSIRL